MIADLSAFGGLTNRNFKVIVEGENDHYMLRIAGEGTEEFIDRKAEEVCARVASKIGINAEILYFDAATGVHGGFNRSSQQFWF